jgi:hypothetical protein
MGRVEASLLATDKYPKKSAVAWQRFEFLPVYKKPIGYASLASGQAKFATEDT